MLQREVAPGVHRVEDSFTNWYLVEGDDGLTIVDAGIPRSWDSLQDALAGLGRTRSDVRALVLTHAHFDHVGFAERARRELGIPVYVHEDDVPLTRHPWRYDHERARTRYLLTQPRALPIVATFLRHRAFWPPPVRSVVRYSDNDGPLPVPGSPTVVPTPGHTLGHCALHLADRGVVFAGRRDRHAGPLHRAHRPAAGRPRRDRRQRTQPRESRRTGGDGRARRPHRPRRAVDGRRRGGGRRRAGRAGGLTGSAAADGLLHLAGAAAARALGAVAASASAAVGADVRSRLVATGRRLVAGRHVGFDRVTHAVGSAGRRGGESAAGRVNGGSNDPKGGR